MTEESQELRARVRRELDVIQSAINTYIKWFDETKESVPNFERFVAEVTERLNTLLGLRHPSTEATPESQNQRTVTIDGEVWRHGDFCRDRNGIVYKAIDAMSARGENCIIFESPPRSGRCHYLDSQFYKSLRPLERIDANAADAYSRVLEGWIRTVTYPIPRKTGAGPRPEDRKLGGSDGPDPG